MIAQNSFGKYRLGRSSAKRQIIFVLGILTCLGPLAIDLYLPVLPAIAQSMNEPLGKIQLTLSSYTLGFALGQLIFGPLSDRFGRMAVMTPGLICYIITSMLVSLSDTANELIMIRVLQAISGAAIIVNIPAMVRDLFHKENCAKALSYILLIMTVAPLVAPMLGGQLYLIGGWRLLFVFLSLFGLIALGLTLFFLKETLPEDKREPLSIRGTILNYKKILTHRNTMCYLLTHAFFFGGLFAFLSGAPFVYIKLFNIAPSDFGLFFAFNVISMAVFNIVNMNLIGRFNLLSLLRFGSTIAMLMSILLIVMVVTNTGGLWGILIPVVINLGMMGFTGPNANALILSNFPSIAGTANAMSGVVRFGIAGIASGLTSFFHDGTAFPMAMIITVCGIMSFVCVMLTKKESEVHHLLQVVDDVEDKEKPIAA